MTAVIPFLCVVTSRVTWTSGTIINRFLTSSPADLVWAVREASITSGAALNLLSGKNPARGAFP